MKKILKAFLDDIIIGREWISFMLLLHSFLWKDKIFKKAGPKHKRSGLSQTRSNVKTEETWFIHDWPNFAPPVHLSVSNLKSNDSEQQKPIKDWLQTHNLFSDKKYVCVLLEI